MENEIVQKLFSKIEAIEKTTNDIKVCIAQLPCKIHDERFKSVDKSLKRVWGVVLIILTFMTGIGISAVIALNRIQ